MQSIFITIVIPTYNCNGVVQRAIKSVRGQTFKSWELLVIDDGSTDQTCRSISDFEGLDSRISLIERSIEREKGANACRNIGIEAASGKYIAMLDSDDEWCKSRLQKLFDFVRVNPAVNGIYCGIKIDDGCNVTRAPVRPIKNGESYADYVMGKDNVIQTSGYVMRRELALKVKFDESLQRHQDVDYFIRFGKAFGWTLMDGYSVIVHWQKGLSRRHHFDSMITFYERHRKDITSANIEGHYLLKAWTQAAKSNSEYKIYYAKRLRQLFMKVNMKYKIFGLFPDLVHFLWKCYRKIK